MLPVTLADSVGGFGAVVSTVTAHGVDAVLELPAASVAITRNE